MVQCLFCKYLSNQVLDFQMFFSPDNWYSYVNFSKQNAVLKQIHSYSCCLIVASKLQNLRKPPPTGPRQALKAPKWRLVGLVTQTNWMDVKTVFILTAFRIYRTSKSNNLSFDHNNLIKIPILLYKFLSPLSSHRNDFVFNTSLAAPGALAHRLQRRTACNTSPPALSKMADGVPK